jgi:hypothetical protein
MEVPYAIKCLEQNTLSKLSGMRKPRRWAMMKRLHKLTALLVSMWNKPAVVECFDKVFQKHQLSDSKRADRE